LQRRLPQQIPGRRGSGDDHLCECRGEDDGHRIIEAGFKLQRDAGALLKIQAAPSQHCKHSRSVGRRDHRAEQERFRPSKPEESRGACGQSCGTDDAERRQRCGRREAAFD
jgi:hypothetical protein